MPYAVELVNVIKNYSTFRAVDNVSLQIKEGEFFSILGPSGCGKTTTLRLIAGFEMPTSGEIYIQTALMGDTPAFKRPVNTVFQNYALFPHMTVAQNVAFGLEMQRVPRLEIESRVKDALQMVRMWERANHRPSQLSGGQQQRVALARALVNKPAVLLLDEPLGALDLKLRKQMQLELMEMQEEIGITFIYVTHDQEEALTMSDRIAVMGNGVVVQCATPEEIYERPLTRYVADFIGETNFLSGELLDTGEIAHIRLKSGTVVPAATNERKVTIGDTVTVAIRPEKITLQRAENGANGVRGVIKDAIYIGTDMRYVVQIGPEQLVARVQNYGGRYDQRIERGAEVILTWATDSARILLD